MKFPAFNIQVKAFLSRKRCLINHINSMCTGCYDHPSVIRCHGVIHRRLLQGSKSS